MRYFFHTIDNGEYLPDEEGSVFDTDEDAREAASACVVEMAGDTILTDAGRRIGIQVVDEAGAAVVAVGVVIERGRDLRSLARYPRL
jgi:hypothetical protein